MLETLARSASLHQKKHEETCRPRWGSPGPQAEELPASETGRPKSGQMGTGKSDLSTGKPSENCKLEFFSFGREPATQL